MFTSTHRRAHTHTHMHVHAHAHTSTRLCTHIHMHAHTSTCARTSTHMHPGPCTSACTRLRVHARISTRMHTRLHVSTHTHTHIHTGSAFLSHPSPNEVDRPLPGRRDAVTHPQGRRQGIRRLDAHHSSHPLPHSLSVTLRSLGAPTASQGSSQTTREGGAPFSGDAGVRNSSRSRREERPEGLIDHPRRLRLTPQSLCSPRRREEGPGPCGALGR